MAPTCGQLFPASHHRLFVASSIQFCTIALSCLPSPFQNSSISRKHTNHRSLMDSFFFGQTKLCPSGHPILYILKSSDNFLQSWGPTFLSFTSPGALINCKTNHNSVHCPLCFTIWPRATHTYIPNAPRPPLPSSSAITLYIPTLAYSCPVRPYDISVK